MAKTGPKKKTCSPEERARLDILAERRRKYVRNNAEKVKEQQKRARAKFYQKNRQKVLQWNVDQRAAKKDQYAARRNVRRKERRKVDLLFVLKDRLRARFRSALKRKKAVKLGTTMELCGCSPEELHAWLPVPKGGAIDHIFPFECYDIKLQSHQKCVMHHTNLQVLTEEENRDKGTRLPTKAMADRVPQWAWPPGVSIDDLPDIYDGWATPGRMR